MAEWLRPLILSALNHLSSHRCGFKPSSGHVKSYTVRLCRICRSDACIFLVFTIYLLNNFSSIYFLSCVLFTINVSHLQISIFVWLCGYPLCSLFTTLWLPTLLYLPFNSVATQSALFTTQLWLPTLLSIYHSTLWLPTLLSIHHSVATHSAVFTTQLCGYPLCSQFTTQLCG